jgi:hypothetical protein
MQQQSKKRLGRTSMEMLVKQQELPDVSADQRASNELIKRIRKLRWMGMEGEAERLQIKLVGAIPIDSVVAEPRETD